MPPILAVLAPELWPPLLACLVVLATLWASPRLLEAWRLYRMMAKLPGPPGLPLVGNLFDVVSLNADAESTPDKVRQLCRQYPSLLRLWCTPMIPIAVLLEPEDIKALLGNAVHVDKPFFYNGYKKILGPGLPFHRRGVWKPIRTAVSSSLHKNILESYVPIFHRNSEEFTQELERLADAGTTFNMTHLCGRAANSTVIDTVLSCDNRDIAQADRNQYMKVLSQTDRLVAKRLWRPWLSNDWLFSLTKDWGPYNDCINFATQFVRGVVDLKRENVAARRARGAGRKVDAPRGRQSFLDVMMASDAHLTMDIEAEARILMNGASGTSMDALSFTYQTLAVRQDLQQRILKELDDVFGGDAIRPVEDADLPHLQALERHVKEVLRMFPPITMFSRELRADLALPSGHVLPRGCIAAIFLPTLHYDPRWFPNPQQFDPDRFLPERSEGLHPYAYIPFSAGPRNCVAYRYAMKFLKTHLATVLRRVQVFPAPGGPTRLEEVRVKIGLATSIPGGARVTDYHWTVRD